MEKFTAKIEYDEKTDEYYLPLGEEVTKKLGWNLGDKLNWKDNGDGSYTITKIEDDMKIFLVETITTFRHRYAIKCKSYEHACDTVVMEEASEFSQEHLGETIVSGREISEEEYLKIHDADNGYIASWPKEKKLEFVHTVDYENT